MNVEFKRKENNSSKFSESVFFKIIVIVFITLFLLIPNAFINDIIYERENNKSKAIEEVSQKWASSQLITGPYLTVPFYKHIKYSNGDSTYFKTSIDTLKILPNKLKIDGDIKPETRYRGIYEVIVYRAKLELKGDFDINEILKNHSINKTDVLQDNIFVNIGLTDLRGIENQLEMKFDDKNLTFSPELIPDEISTKRISSNIILDTLENNNLNFSMNLSLKGSENLNFLPFGKSTNIKLKSNWNSPSFDGNFLPESRTINENGFIAEWKIQHFNRNFPQSWIEGTISLTENIFGVNLLLPVNNYQKNYRAINYAILFLALTFTMFFFFEIFNKLNLHPIHYLLIGFSLILFFILLLSISEQLFFNLAYIISSAAIVCLISLYTLSISKSWRFALIVSAVLVLLYTFILVLISLEDLSLLVGSIGLFLILASIMYSSRKIDWYNLQFSKKTNLEDLD